MNVRLRTLPYLLVLVLAVVAGNLEARTYISDPKIPDTVRVDSVRALRASHVMLPIYVYFDEPLAGMEITITSRSSAVTLDSFSYQGSVVDYIELKGAMTEANALTAYAFPYSDFFIYVAHGLFGKVFVTVSDTASVGAVTIDSTTVVVDLVEHSTTFSDLNLETFIPQYREGKVDIQDSCCVGTRGNVDGSADDNVDIGDLTALINYLFLGATKPLACPEEADVALESGTETIDISDLTKLVQFLFIDATTPFPSCQTAP